MNSLSQSVLCQILVCVVESRVVDHSRTSAAFVGIIKEYENEEFEKNRILR